MTLQQQESPALHERMHQLEHWLIQRINLHPPRVPGPMGLGLWLLQHAEQEQNSTFQDMEAHYGEPWCNRWLCDVLCRTQVFTQGDEEETMVQVVPGEVHAEYPQ